MMDLVSSSDLPHPKRRRTNDSLPLPPSTTTDLGESQTSSGLNPLLIELVLDNLFKYCDKTQLDQCRLVCTLWHQVSLPFWTARLDPICLKEDDRHAIYPKPAANPKSIIPEEEKRRPPSLRSFLEQVHKINSTSTSLSPYEFPGVRKAPGFNVELLTPAIDAGLLDSFWRNCGRWISTLKLSDFYCQDIALFKDIVCSRFTPNLEKLSLEVELLAKFKLHEDISSSSSSNDDDDPGYKENKKLKSLDIMMSVADAGDEDGVNRITQFPLEWSQVLILYPNLETLAVCHVWRTFQSEFKRILEAIKGIRERSPEKLKSLKSIDLLYDEDACFLPGEQLDPCVVGLLRHPLLNFSSLGLRFDEVNDEQLRILRDILTYHTSLKKLSFFMPLHLHNTLRLGVIPHLEVLHAYGFPFSSFSFLRSFPNLEALHLYSDKEEGDGDEGLTIVSGTLLARGTEELQLAPLARLTEFACDYQFGIWGSDAVDMLHNWMPNLSILKMELDDETFSLVCGAFPNLDELVVWGDGLSDRGLVGCTTVGRNPSNQAALLCPFYQPNITAFTRLKSFEMDVGSKRLALKFSVLSVVHGFAALPELRSLEINAYVKIRPSVVRALQEQLPFAKIIYHN